MKRIVFVWFIVVVLLAACQSSTDDADQPFEPVPEQYRTITVPVINQVD